MATELVLKPRCVSLQACGLMFPRADGVAAMLDASLYDRQALLSPPENTYPLVVRLETITPKGEAEGHTLQVPPPDRPLCTQVSRPTLGSDRPSAQGSLVCDETQEIQGGRIAAAAAAVGELVSRFSQLRAVWIMHARSVDLGLEDRPICHAGGVEGASRHLPGLHSCRATCLGAASKLLKRQQGLSVQPGVQELQPGAPQETWVQSQTTFVGLIEDDGLLLPRVKKQKIWVEAVSYELQEIYGMEQAAGSARTKEVRLSPDPNLTRPSPVPDLVMPDSLSSTARFIPGLGTRLQSVFTRTADSTRALLTNQDWHYCASISL